MIQKLFNHNSKSEDAINIINSNSKIENLYFKNIQADAIDIDFGTLFLKILIVKNIKNDCLDVSGATVIWRKFISNNIDKGIKFWRKLDVKYQI